MRIEKGYLHWKAELLTEFDPFETGLGRFVRPGKGEFVGRSALLAREASGPRKRLVTLAIDCEDREAHGGASVMDGRRVVGTVTSGAWGHRTGLNLAMAFVAPECAGIGARVEIDMAGTCFPAEVIAPCPYDPEGARVRS